MTMPEFQSKLVLCFAQILSFKVLDVSYGGQAHPQYTQPFEPHSLPAAVSIILPHRLNFDCKGLYTILPKSRNM